MIAVIYAALFVGLALYELPPLLKNGQKKDAAAFFILMLLAAGAMTVLIVLSQFYGLRTYLW